LFCLYIRTATPLTFEIPYVHQYKLNSLIIIYNVAQKVNAFLTFKRNPVDFRRDFVFSKSKLLWGDNGLAILAQENGHSAAIS